MPSSRFIHIFLIAGGILIFFNSCMRNYQPNSSWEQSEYEEANFKIHPDEVRKNLSAYQNDQIAWVGIIQETEFYESEDHIEVILLLEHHFFDWKEENFVPDEMYYPSNLGQGLFQTNWYLKKSADLEYFKGRFAPGNLAIVYAQPDTVIKEVVLVKSRYIRVIDRNNFQLDHSDYVPQELAKPPSNYHGTDW